MKYLFLIVFTLCAMALTMPATGFAYNNEIGFYTDMEQSAVNIEIDYTTIFFIYVMINNPYNDLLGEPVETIGAFEFTVGMPQGAYILITTYPAPAVNVAYGYNEYIVGFGAPLIVNPDIPTLVVTFQILAAYTTPDQFIFIGPTNSPNILGEISYYDYINYTNIPMNNVIGGDLTNPIFAINPTEQIIAADHISFDAVKALYR